MSNDARPSVVTGVTGVTGAASSRPDRTSSSSSFAPNDSAGGAGVFLSTLSGLNGTNPVEAHAAVMFLLVNALTLAELYKEVKCSLPTVSMPPRYSLST